MKFAFSFIFIFSIVVSLSALSIVISVSAQTVEPTPSRPRVVASSASTPAPTPYTPATPSPTPPHNVVITNNLPAPTPQATPTVAPTSAPITNSISIDRPITSALSSPIGAYKVLPLGQLRGKIDEAKRLMASRPMPTALTGNSPATDVVRVAFYDWGSSRIDFVMLSKPSFLSKFADVPAYSTNGKRFTVRIQRSNFVNTAVTIFDANNQPQTPLIVQYPIEKSGSFREMAYYTSAHPGLITPEIINAGKLYVRNTLEIGREKLREKGIYISPQLMDIAERLAVVEHVDHQRFWTEYHLNLYNEIYALYALNEGNTYNYSVSTAGAGGMIQMIPWTYNMVRMRYPQVGLIPDFVTGMRNHINAAQVMLLYMQMTWSELSYSETVINALSSGVATQADLMAAGYNSNPAKLPGYIKRGGANWRALIPRETKIYLQIYESLERNVPMTPRTK
jgi:hypothetical protein